MECPVPSGSSEGLYSLLCSLRGYRGMELLSNPATEVLVLQPAGCLHCPLSGEMYRAPKSGGRSQLSLCP